MSKTEKLVEDFFDQSRLTFQEGDDTDLNKDGSKKLYLVGKVQSTEENQNGRVYSGEVWDSLHEDSKFKSKLEKGLLLGSIGHPKDGIYEPEKSAIVVRKHWREGKDILAKIEVLDTPSGKVLRTLYDSGVELGISSRGKGESKMENGKVHIIPGKFTLEGYDAVIDPSVKDATPEYKMEQKQIATKFNSLVESRMTSDDFCEEESHMLQMIMEEYFPKSTSETLDESNDNKSLFNDKLYEKLSQFNYNNKSDSDMKNLEEALEENKNLQEEKVTLTEAKAKAEGDVNALTEKYNTLEGRHKALKTITVEHKNAAETSKKELAEAKDAHKVTERRLNAAKELIAESLKQRDQLAQEKSQLESKLDASKKIIESYATNQEKMNSESLSSKIAESVSEFPENVRPKVKAILESASNEKQLKALVVNLAEMNGIDDPTLNRGGAKPTNTVQEGKDKTYVNAEGNEITEDVYNVLAPYLKETYDFKSVS